jgi:hypothetical protein
MAARTHAVKAFLLLVEALERGFADGKLHLLARGTHHHAIARNGEPSAWPFAPGSLLSSTFRRYLR